MQLAKLSFVKGQRFEKRQYRIFYRIFNSFIIIGILFSPISSSLAADPQAYQAQIHSTGNSDIDQTLSDNSNLMALQKTKAIGAFALAGRIQSDYGRLKTVMDSFGYYDAKVTIKIGIHENSKQIEVTKANLQNSSIDSTIQPDSEQNKIQDVDGKDPLLSSFIEHIPPQQDAMIQINIQKGPQYHIGKINLVNVENNTIILTKAQQQAFELVPGRKAISADIVAAKERLLVALQEEGHALVQVKEPIAYLRPNSKTLDLEYKVTPGPILNLGDIEFQGLQKVNKNFVYKRLLLHSGQLYQPSKIEEARQDLSGLNVFSSIDVRAANKPGIDGRLPLFFTFKEAKRHTVSAEAGYSTDLGGRGGIRWTHHNLFGNAEQLKLAALATGLGGTAQRGLGYDLYADLTKPDFGRRDQSFNARIEAVKQLLYSYDQTAFLAQAGLERKLNDRWNISAYLGGIQERIIQQNIRNDYTMVNIPLNAAYDSTGLSNLMSSPTHGMRASVTVTPTESFGGEDTFFTIMQGTASTYFDLTYVGISDPGRSILAFRTTLGSVQGASLMRLPPDQRLYAGGTATVRGFRFQGVGPQFAHSKYAIGGTSLDAGTIEYRQRILQQFGMQVFADAGQVGENGIPFQGKLRVGVGAGGKYYTPLGPIRLDVAVPVNRPPHGDHFELYIGLGETF